MKNSLTARGLKSTAFAVLALALACGAVPAFGFNNTRTTPTTAAAEKLTLDGAAAAAIAASDSLKSYEENIPIAEKNLSDLYDALMQSSGSADYVNYMSQIMQAKSKRDIDAQNARVTKQQLTVSVWQAFGAIVSAQNALALYDQSLDMQKRQLEISKVRLKLGMMSKNDFNAAANSYEKAVSDRASKASAVGTAYINLNRLLGRSLSRRYDLEIPVEYKPMNHDNLIQDVAAAMDGSPGVQALLDSMEVTRFRIKYFDDAEPQAQTMDQLNASLNGDNRSLSEAKRSIEQKIIAQNTKILQQEASYSTEAAALKALKEQLAVKETQLGLGMITQLDVDSAKLSVASQEESLRGLAVDHAVSVMQYQWPNTL